MEKVKNILIVKYLLFLALLSFLSACHSEKEIKVYEFSGQTMGTTYSIKIVSKLDSFQNSKIQSGIDSVLIDINQKMSTYIKDSELSKFNNYKDTNWVKVSKDLAIVIFKALEISKASNGMYDITIGPLVNLWGFGPKFNDKKIPSDKEIFEQKKNIGYKNILIDMNNLRIKKRNKNIYCDLSSIAKGYGVDKVGIFLEDMGIKNYMVEIGGEVRTKGENGENKKWKIGIATPTNDGLQKIVNLSNYSMATSGDYLNYFEENGIRYSHTINPITGKPITHNLASVTVIHINCCDADAYATAIDVMGPKEGYKFALKQKLPIFMIVRENNGFVEKMTPQFNNFISTN